MQRGRKGSVATSDHSGHGMALGHAHHGRRASRIDPMHMAGMGRRMSFYRRGSIAASLRTDRTDQSHGPLIQLANTYRTGPEQHEKFQSSKVQPVLQHLLESYLEGENYEARRCAHLAQSLTDVIKARIKEMHFPRYKLICNVVIGQKCEQGIRCASRCLWDNATDNSASASYQNSTLFAIATVYGLYFE